MIHNNDTDETNSNLGKSTLMRFIVDDHRTTSILKQWSIGEGHIIGKHFFWKIGIEDEHSQLGLLRPLLYDILSQKRRLIRKVLPEERERYTRECQLPSGACKNETQSRPWNPYNVQRALELAIPSCGKLCIFIDGLDEYSGDSVETAQYLQMLTTSNSNIKICVSSRPEEVSKEVFRGQPMLRLQDLTRQDISHYVSSELQKLSLIRGLSVFGVSELCKEIVEKAQGVFLWVALVVRSLLVGLVNADRIQDLQQRLQAMPTELNEMYGYMLRSNDQRYWEEGLQLFRFVSYTSEHSSSHCALAASFYLQGIGHMLQLPEATLSSGCLTVAAVSSRVSFVEKRLQVCCKGLMELAPRTSIDGVVLSDLGNQRIVYIHRTAAEFIQKTCDDDLFRRHSTQTKEMPPSWLRSQVQWFETLLSGSWADDKKRYLSPSVLKWAFNKVIDIAYEVQATLTPGEINTELVSMLNALEKVASGFDYDDTKVEATIKNMIDEFMYTAITRGLHVYVEANLTRKNIEVQGVTYLNRAMIFFKERPRLTRRTPSLLKFITILLIRGTATSEYPQTIK